MAGEIALKSPQPDATKAEGYFERALAVARQQQAKSWELRAAMSLARLWRDQGKVQQARELLAPVYGWFIEGFDTRTSLNRLPSLIASRTLSGKKAAATRR
jgi:predicted ATPase